MNAPALYLSGTARIGAVVLFAPIKLDVPAGCWTCLLGASGIGKTTVLRFLAGLATGVAFDGAFGAADGLPLPGRVALMAQNDLLLPWLDCLGNVTLGARLRGHFPDTARAMAMLEKVGLADIFSRKPAQLSGGQRQRVALARTLMEDRPIVLLDEPFSALDARTRAQMQDMAASLLVDRTVLMVTHDPAEAARLGDQILLMTADGLQHLPATASPPPRAVDDPETLTLQGRLLRLLMEAA